MMKRTFRGSLHRRVEGAPAFHRLDAPTPEQIITAPDHIAGETIMADQVPAVMHHFHEMILLPRGCGGERTTRMRGRPHRHAGGNDERSQ